MPEIRIGDIGIQATAGDNLLDTLLRAGQRVPWSCRAGQCQTCLVQTLEGNAPIAAVSGLDPEQREAGWVLACQCPVLEDMRLKLHDPARDGLGAQLVATHQAAGNILILQFKPDRPLRFKPGQHLVIWLDSELGRPYSIASQPGEAVLTFHLKLHHSGAFSDRIQTLKPGERVYLGAPGGHFHYDPDWQDRPLLLLAAGTGLAPLRAIAMQALALDHQAPIQLYHWHDEQGCYLEGPMRELAESQPKLTLHLRPRTELAADLTQLRLASRSTLALVCGPPVFVEQVRKPLFLAGLPGRQILDEAFLNRQT